MIVLTKPFDELALDYVGHLLSSGQIVDRAREFRVFQLVKFFKKSDSISPLDVDKLMKGLSKNKPATRNRLRAQLSAILRWATDRDMTVGELPKRTLRIEPEKNERMVRLSREQENLLMMGLGPEMRDTLIAAVDTGLRKGALLKLTFMDVRDGNLVVPPSIQKTGQAQIIPMTKRLKEVVTRRLTDEGFNHEARIFHFSERSWQNAKAIAKLPDLHWHDLRGEFASRLAEKGVQINVVSRLLGHSNLSTTQRYLRPRVADFEEAIKKLEM